MQKSIPETTLILAISQGTEIEKWEWKRELNFLPSFSPEKPNGETGLVDYDSTMLLVVMGIMVLSVPVEWLYLKKK